MKGLNVSRPRLLYRDNLGIYYWPPWLILTTAEDALTRVPQVENDIVVESTGG